MQGAEGCCLEVLSTFETQKSVWLVQPGEMKEGTRADPPVHIHQRTLQVWVVKGAAWMRINAGWERRGIPTSERRPLGIKWDQNLKYCSMKCGF